MNDRPQYNFCQIRKLDPTLDSISWSRSWFFSICNYLIQLAGPAVGLFDKPSSVPAYAPKCLSDFIGVISNMIIHAWSVLYKSLP